MKGSPVLFLSMFFLSSVGDALFLSGIPLFLFVESGGRLSSLTLLSVIISVTIVVGRKVIFKINQSEPLLTTAYGEWVMASIEVLLLGFWLLTGSVWVIAIALVPLAMTYNAYAPAKFLRLQDYFYSDQQRTWLTSVQSSLDKIGLLVGMAISGWIVSVAGIVGILVLDAITFSAFGLYAYWASKHEEEEATNKLASDAGKSESVSEEADSLKRLAPLLLPFVVVITVIIAWDETISIGILQKDHPHQALATLTFLKATLGVAGMIAGTLLARCYPKYLYWLWFSIPPVVGSLLLMSFDLKFLVVFFLAGIIGSTIVVIEREIIAATSDAQSRGKRASQLWIASSVAKISIPALALILDSLDPSLVNGSQASGFFILFVFTLGFLSAPIVRLNLAKLPIPAIGLLLLAFGLQSCSWFSSPKEDQPYRVAFLGTPPRDLSTVDTGEYSHETLFSQVCARLTRITETLDVEGDLAGSWSISDDLLTYRFKLDKNRVFFDGSPVRPIDIKKSIDDTITRIGSQRSRTYLSFYLSRAPEVTVLGSRELEVKIPDPNPYFLQELAHTAFCIVSSENPTIGSGASAVVNSAGGYRIQRKQGKRIKLGRHRGDGPSQVVVDFLEHDAAVRAFEEGQLDDLTFFLLDDQSLSRLRASSSIFESKVYWTWMLLLNPKSQAFRKKEWRRDFVRRFPRSAFLKKWNAEVIDQFGLIPNGMRGATTLSEISKLLPKLVFSVFSSQAARRLFGCGRP
jgi:hypothetical protein